jgi:hypothetical protein
MNQNSNPIEYLINIASESGVSSFIINNAKDELKKLRSITEFFSTLPIAYVKANNNGYLFDLTFHYNPYNSENTIALYANQEELKKLLDRGRC